MNTKRITHVTPCSIMPDNAVICTRLLMGAKAVTNTKRPQLQQ